MNCKILLVPKDIDEEGFLEWCKKNYDIQGFKITKHQLSYIQQAILGLEDYQDRWAYYSELINQIQMIKDNKKKRCGLPDFFLYTKKMVLLCEFKSMKDKLSLEQVYWFEQNKNLPLAIAMAFDPEKIIKEENEEYDEDLN